MTLATKFHKEYPKEFENIILPLDNGGSVSFMIEKTDHFGGGWLTIPVISPIGVK